MITMSRLIVSASPVIAATLLYVLFGYLDIIGWVRLALSASMGLASANFAQAATLSSLAGTSLYRSQVMRRFYIDTALSFCLSIPVAMILHARILRLEFGWPAVYSSAAWAPWFSRGGGIATLFVTFVFAMGLASLIRLFINRLTRHY